MMFRIKANNGPDDGAGVVYSVEPAFKWAFTASPQIGLSENCVKVNKRKFEF